MSNKYYFTSDDLISSVKQRASIPDSQNWIDDEKILGFANEKMQLNLIPLVISKYEDYYLVRESVALVTGQTSYDIPYRAISNKLREVAYMPNSSYPTDLREMVRICTDDITNQNTSTVSSKKYYLQGEKVVLHVSTTEVLTGYLVFFYWLRPNSLVECSRIATVTSINSTTGVISFSSIPSHFTESLEYDFIQTKSPHRVIDYDISVTSIDSGAGTMTFATADIPSDLIVGDRVGIAGETDVINCPSDLHPYLAELTANRLLASLGLLEDVQASNSELAEMKQNASMLLDNRVIGSPFKVKPRNGFLRGRNGRRRGF